MDFEDLKAKLTLSERKNKKLGIGIFITFGLILTPIFIFADTDGRSIKILIGFFIFLMACGVLVFVKGQSSLKKILDDTHPILDGIKSRSDYLVWIYHTISKMEGDESGKRNWNSVSAVGKDGKRYSFSAKSEIEVGEIIDYLNGEFPNAVLGYTLDNQHEVERIIGKKLR